MAARDKLYDSRKMTPLVKRILHEIMRCPYRAEIRRMYMEGKILDLLAVYMDEVLLEKGSLPRDVALSKTDIASLRQAKQIVDANLIAPPSLVELSRLICLNEYKLKKGFKELFGLPVHAYVIDQRLELARCLLEQDGSSVTYAASMVGFNNLGQFAET
ncbi:DNA-binding domain-containing protein, AraC-type [Brevibacillus sp. CF112]|uniref:helix-turn-helix transcriptional regulator n=1 Tax=Brevibacillus TaxID=55080 RepID=UPI000271BC66|nr:AraC family transcriptional regulator [Brevibacillus sp. CF112]EJL38746.1 DNA-binding domain-containing protein, AraC-type [Brevibacillus sp. CF112]